MTQSKTHHPRGGWQKDEIDLLFEAVREATREGRPLRNVFSDVGGRLQRKPNSIRNYYYARVRETPELAPRQAPFRAFTPQELHQLLRDVLIARGRGESVRACVMRLSCGDRSAMLRYQNKYRSILKNRPETLLRVAEELRAEGLPCPDCVVAFRRYGQAPQKESADALTTLGRYADDAAVAALLNAVCELLTRSNTVCAALRERKEADAETDRLNDKWAEARREADRLRVEVDLLKMALEDAQTGAADRQAFDAEPDGDY